MSNDATMTKQNKMAIVPVKKLVMQMSLPVIFSMLIQSLYNFVDSIFIARINQEALTALSLAFPLQLLVVAVFVGLGVGINSLMSRKLGEEDRESAQYAAENGLILGVILSVVVAVVGYIGAKGFFGLFTKDQQIIDYGITYIRIVMIFAFGRILSKVGMSCFQGTGEMVQPMIAQLIGAISNIILDPILIFGFFGLPAMGVKGAAIATIAAQILGMSYIWLRLMFGKKGMKPRIRHIKFKGSIMKQIIFVGLPVSITQGIGSLMVLGFNFILSAYGDAAIAVLGAYFKIQSMVFMPVFGLSTGSMPIMGFNYGAKNKERFTETIRFAAILAVTYMTVCLVAFQIFPRGLLSLYDSTPEMTAIGIKAFRRISLMFPFTGASIIMSVSFQALGKAKYSMYYYIVKYVLLSVPFGYLFSNLWGLDAVWYGFPLGEVLAISLVLLMFVRIYRAIDWQKA